MDIKHINNDLEVRQSNIITNARYDMSACELDLIFCVLSQLKKSDDNNEKYYLYVKDIATITDRQWNYQQLRQASYNLISRVYEYTNEKGNLVQISLFSSCEYINGEGIIEVEISPKMRPHLFDLKEKFTSFRLLASLSMNSKYGKRIYLLCCQWKDIGVFKMTIEELKFKLHLKDPKGKNKEQYVKINDFQRSVLNSAMEDINKHTELRVKYELIKRGRAFKEIIFTIDLHKEQTIPLLFEEDLESQKIKKILTYFNITRNDLVTKICNDKNLHKIVYKWHYDYKLGNFSNVQNHAGHLLKTLGLVSSKK